MGAGLILMVVGAILAFAVTDHVPNINLGVVGLILMLAGVASIANNRRQAVRKRVVTTRDEAGGTQDTHVVEVVERENDVDQVHREGGRY